MNSSFHLENQHCEFCIYLAFNKFRANNSFLSISIKKCLFLSPLGVSAS